MSPVQGTKRPFYDHPLFKGTAAVVALLGAVLALTGQLGEAIDNLVPDPQKKTVWTEVVLDTSAEMGEGFGDGGGTRLESAIEGVAKAVKELDNTNVGLRTTSTTCEGESRPLVDLAEGTPDEVIKRAKAQQPDGRASIADAVVGGLEEFNREPMREHGAKSRRLLVFTTDSEPCEWDQLLADEVEARLKRIAKVGDIEVLALRSQSESQTVALADSGAGELGVLEGALGAKVEIHYVSTPDELYEEAERAGEVIGEIEDDPDDLPSG